MTKWNNKSHDELLNYLSAGDSMPKSQAELHEIAMHSVFSDVRKAAVRKITDQNALAEIAAYDESYEVYKMAVDRIFEEKYLEKVVSQASDKYACSLAVRKIEDADTLLRIAQTHIYTEVRIEALHNLDCADCLLQVAEQNSDSDVRAAAVKKLASQQAIAQIAMRDEDPAVYRTAIKTMTDPEKLVEIALDNIGKIKGTVALYRLRELSHKIFIDKCVINRLFPLFRETTSVIIVIGLMEKAGSNWFSLCDLDTVEILRREYSLCDPQNSQFIERIIKSLYAHRPDLRNYILAKEWLTPCGGDDTVSGNHVMRRFAFFKGA